MQDFQIHVTQGSYPVATTSFFDFDKIDAFHHPDVLTVIYGTNWHSVLVVNRNTGEALLHAYTLQPLPESASGYDIEPFIGYAGPVLTPGSSVQFRDAAWALYSEHCRANGVVAEIIRFNPILNNAADFEGSALFRVFNAKSIVVAECYANEGAQLASFDAKCRSSVKRGQRDCTFELLDKKTDWEEFVTFYYASLDRIGAAPKWYFSRELFDKAAHSSLFQVYLVRCQGKWVSLALVIDHPQGSYYFVAASSPQPAQGANELLIFGITRALSQRGIQYLILGGGNTASDTDPLLRFKRKFALAPTPLLLGRSVHDASAFAHLVAQAVSLRPELIDIPFFLKYRL